MPAKSIAQQRLFGQAYAVKKGKLDIKDINPQYRDEIKKLVKSLSKKKLKDFAATPHTKKDGEKLPYKVENENLSFNLYSFEEFMYEEQMHQEYVLKNLNLDELVNIFEDKDEDEEINAYNKAIAKAIIELLKIKQKYSKDNYITPDLIRKIVDEFIDLQLKVEGISDNREDWKDLYEDGLVKSPNMIWQHRFNPVVFSKDGGKTWFVIDEALLGYVEICLENVFLNPGMNVPGIGPVDVPGDPGTNNDFYSQKPGSGDMAYNFNEPIYTQSYNNYGAIPQFIDKLAKYLKKKEKKKKNKK